MKKISTRKLSNTARSEGMHMKKQFNFSIDFSTLFQKSCVTALEAIFHNCTETAQTSPDRSVCEAISLD